MATGSCYNEIVRTPAASVLLVSQAEYTRLLPAIRERILGAVSYGGDWRDSGDQGSLMVNSGLKRLDGDACIELWLSPTPTVFVTDANWQVASNEHVRIMAAQVKPGASLAKSTEALYGSLFPKLRGTPHPHLLRAWAVLGHINSIEAGLERYRQFCLGRYAGLISFLPPHVLPAATAVGSPKNNLTAWFLCASTSGVQIENPRQLSAYRYPARYGPRSPTFARATLWSGAGKDLLFVSGTASIVGHESLHPGDAKAQVRESLLNIEALLLEVQRISEGHSFTPSACWLKVYLRNPFDYSDVRQAVDKWAAYQTKVTYLVADICRSELLVEIEGLFF